MFISGATDVIAINLLDMPMRNMNPVMVIA